jgi:NadR type nicotinamide-nucleotide adenylyltransferase
MEEGCGQMNKVLKIAMLGPESTGKTELCKQLASHFNTVWVPEYAREYLSAKQNQYTYDDVLYCLNQQLLLEEQMQKQANKILFCDTELINFKVWFKDIFNKAPVELEDKIKTHTYDLTILTYYDIPFEPDIVRVMEHRREYFFIWYQRELKDYGFNYSIIKGLGKERVSNAISSVNMFLQLHKAKY